MADKRKASLPTNAKFTRATGSGAVSITLTNVNQFMIREVRLHLSSAATQDSLIMQIDSATSSVYDSVLYLADMNGSSDGVLRPQNKIILAAGDSLVISFANNDARTAGLEVIHED